MRTFFLDKQNGIDDMNVYLHREVMSDLYLTDGSIVRLRNHLKKDNYILTRVYASVGKVSRNSAHVGLTLRKNLKLYLGELVEIDAGISETSIGSRTVHFSLVRESCGGAEGINIDPLLMKLDTLRNVMVREGMVIPVPALHRTLEYRVDRIDGDVSETCLYGAGFVKFHRVVSRGDGPDFSLYHYDNLCGMDEQLKELRKCVELPMLYPHLFEKIGCSMPSGILITGPSKSGKTSIARAMRNETPKKFIYYNCSSFLADSASNIISNILDPLNEHEGSEMIVFFDDIDLILNMNLDNDRNPVQHLVYAMLYTIECLCSNKLTKCICTARYKDSIPKHFMQAGRLERHIELTDSLNVADVLKCALSNTLAFSTSGVDSFLNRASGMNSGDIFLAVEKALYSKATEMMKSDNQESLSYNELKQLVIGAERFSEARPPSRSVHSIGIFDKQFYGDFTPSESTAFVDPYSDLKLVYEDGPFLPITKDEVAEYEKNCSADNGPFGKSGDPWVSFKRGGEFYSRASSTSGAYNSMIDPFAPRRQSGDDPFAIVRPNSKPISFDDAFSDPFASVASKAAGGDGVKMNIYASNSDPSWPEIKTRPNDPFGSAEDSQSQNDPFTSANKNQFSDPFEKIIGPRDQQKGNIFELLGSINDQTDKLDPFASVSKNKRDDATIDADNSKEIVDPFASLKREQNNDASNSARSGQNNNDPFADMKQEKKDVDFDPFFVQKKRRASDVFRTSGGTKKNENAFNSHDQVDPWGPQTEIVKQKDIDPFSVPKRDDISLPKKKGPSKDVSSSSSSSSSSEKNIKGGKSDHKQKKDVEKEKPVPPPPKKDIKKDEPLPPPPKKDIKKDEPLPPPPKKDIKKDEPLPPPSKKDIKKDEPLPPPSKKDKKKEEPLPPPPKKDKKKEEPLPPPPKKDIKKEEPLLPPTKIDLKKEKALPPPTKIDLKKEKALPPPPKKDKKKEDPLPPPPKKDKPLPPPPPKKDKLAPPPQKKGAPSNKNYGGSSTTTKPRSTDNRDTTKSDAPSGLSGKGLKRSSLIPDSSYSSSSSSSSSS